MRALGSPLVYSAHARAGTAEKHRETGKATNIPSERAFAWLDKFRALLVRSGINKIHFVGSHCLAFALINLRNSFA
jgi:hypothetical protein